MKSKIKIAVTGASGNIGAQLIPVIMEKRDWNVIVVGRDLAKLDLLFPDCTRMNYEQFFSQKLDVDAVIHLAVANNTSKYTYDEFFSVNVTLTEKVIEHVSKNNVETFIFSSSIHVLDGNKTDAYSKTKRLAESLVDNSRIKATKYVYSLPPIYGSTFFGKLKALNKLPISISNIFIRLILLVKNMMSIEQLEAQIYVDVTALHKSK